MKSIILKFGGTSLNGNEKLERLKNLVANYIQKDYKVICVVSAIGRKEPYSTDTLKDLVEIASDRDLARLYTIGEIVSSIVVCEKLLESNIRSKTLDYRELGIKTDSNYLDANILGVDIKIVQEALRFYDCLVIPGYQGSDPFSNITTLGRGGSDTTAVALGVALGSDEIIIVSDVEGIYSGDPKQIDDVIFYDFIGYDELLKITLNGSKVLHEKAAFIAHNSKCNLTFMSNKENSRTTKVLAENQNISCVSSKGNVEYAGEKGFTRIALLKNGVVNVIYVKDEKAIEEIRRIHKKILY